MDVGLFSKLVMTKMSSKSSMILRVTMMKKLLSRMTVS